MSVKIFFCYAREDKALRDQLEVHLAGLKRQYQITTWHDREISAGTEWEREIDIHLNTAHIILLLISPHFMASDYCYSIEMKRALDRHEAGTSHVIPILLRPVDWEDAPFSKLQILPTDSKAITSWPNLDEAFWNVTKGIRKTVIEFLSQETKEKWLREGSYHDSERQLVSASKSISPQREAPTVIEIENPARFIISGAGSEDVQEYLLNKPKVTIGRTPDNDISLKDILTARHHASVRYENGDYVLRDEKSPNGTLVNGRQIRLKILQDGDRVVVGRTELCFVIGEIENPARFIISSAGSEGVQEYLLNKPKVTIGRALHSDILLLKDELISGYHATVRYEHGNYVLRDEGSTTGTNVNGEQLEEMTPYILQDRDKVVMGETELFFVVSSTMKSQ